MATSTVGAGGIITISDLTAHRLDFAPLRITGQAVCGEPEYRGEALGAANESRIRGSFDFGIGRVCGNAILRLAVSGCVRPIDGEHHLFTGDGTWVLSDGFSKAASTR